MQKVVGLLAVALVVVGAAACESSADRWVGHHYRDAIDGWGPPSDVRPDGSGGWIMVWASQGSGDGPSDSYYAEGEGNGTRFDVSETWYWKPDVYRQRRSRLLYVGKDGFVYGEDWIAR